MLRSAVRAEPPGAPLPRTAARRATARARTLRAPRCQARWYGVVGTDGHGMLCPPRLTGEQRTLITRGIDGDPPDPAGRATACSRGVVDRASRSDPGVDRGGRDLGGR